MRDQLDRGANNLSYTSSDVDNLRNQLELTYQEKQAYFMISNDIQNLIASAVQDISN